jgi:hypothetical protein
VTIHSSELAEVRVAFCYSAERALALLEELEGRLLEAEDREVVLDELAELCAGTVRGPGISEGDTERTSFAA